CVGASRSKNTLTHILRPARHRATRLSYRYRTDAAGAALSVLPLTTQIALLENARSSSGAHCKCTRGADQLGQQKRNQSISGGVDLVIESNQRYTYPITPNDLFPRPLQGMAIRHAVAANKVKVRQQGDVPCGNSSLLSRWSR